MVDFGISRCLAAAVKLPVSATAAKTTIAFRSGPCWLIVLFLEQSFLESYSSPISRTMVDLAHDTRAFRSQTGHPVRRHEAVRYRERAGPRGTRGVHPGDHHQRGEISTLQGDFDYDKASS